MAAVDSQANEGRARLCHLRRWPNFHGYGFNLHCDKKKLGQFIGKVDVDSPAESAGLRENDRIIEVNFVPIGTENHKQVVSRIKEGVTRNNTKYPDEVILLVVDPETDASFSSRSIVVRSSDPNVIKLETEIRTETNSNPKQNDSSRVSSRTSSRSDSTSLQNDSETNLNYKRVTDFTGPTVTQTNVKTNVKTNTNFALNSENSDGEFDENVLQKIAAIRPSPIICEENRRDNFSSSPQNSNPKSNASFPSSAPSQNSNEILQLSMSAAEYREKLRAQSARKRDPRQEKTLSMKQKHALIDGL